MYNDPTDVRTATKRGIAIALEEAARVAESYEPRCDTCPRGAAAAIRAMIPSGNDQASDATGNAG
jgi:hypothetical protein